MSLVTKSIETNRRRTQQGDYIVPSHWPLSMSLNESPAPFMQKGGQQKDGAVLGLLYQRDAAPIKRLGRGLGREYHVPYDHCPV